MSQPNMEQLITLITRQVVQALSQQESPCACAQTEGHSKLLVLGDCSIQLPDELCRNAVIHDVEDYKTNRNILRYQKVVITRLTITQMADIALGREGDEVSSAVLQALLNGVDVTMLENAPEFRQYSGKGSTALYHLLEGYAQTLLVFGVKTFKPGPKTEPLPAKPAKFSPPPVPAPVGSAVPNIGRLITEADALALVKTGSTVHIPAGSILTPSARDVFAQSKVTLVQDA